MDMTVWLDYFTAALATQMEETKQRGRRVIQVDVVAREHGLTDRQRSIVFCCAEYGEVGIGDLTRHLPGIPRRSLQRDLKHLLDAGILTATGRTTNKRYSFQEFDL